jgi:hypothetical protein
MQPSLTWPRSAVLYHTIELPIPSSQLMRLFNREKKEGDKEKTREEESRKRFMLTFY